MKPLKAFISYSHKDDLYKGELEAHLSLLKRQGLIEIWHDRLIMPGTDWEKEINENIYTADLIFVLVSADLIASDYCYEKELSIAINRHENNEACLIPIFCRYCDWKGVPFEKIQGLPKDAKPISSWSDRDLCWTQICSELRSIIAVANSKKRQILYSKNGSIRDEYLNHLVEEYEKTWWTKRALDLKIKGGKTSRNFLLSKKLIDWINYSSECCLFLLGDYGSGKTWALKRLARDLVKNPFPKVSTNSSLIPVFVQLGLVKNKAGEVSFENAIGDWATILKSKNKTDLFLFLLDGLDEIGFSADEYPELLIKELINSAPKNSRFIISCRTQAFEKLSVIKVLDFLKASYCYEDPTDWAIAKVTNKPVVLVIDELEEQHAESYILNGDSSSYWKHIPNKSELLTLIKKPVLLPLIEKILPVLGEDNLVAKYYKIYEYATKVWILRDRHCYETFNQSEIKELFQNFAYNAFPNIFLTLNEFEKLCGQSQKARALINSDLFLLDSQDRIYFSHHTFFEYAYACLLEKQLSQFNARNLAMANLINLSTVNVFLVEMLLEKNRNSPQMSNESANLIFLEQNMICGTEIVVSNLITKEDYFNFIRKTGWRLEYGYGIWTTFNNANGRPPFSSEFANFKEICYNIFDSEAKSNDFQEIATGISWYDAWVFCYWLGGRLPDKEEILKMKADEQDFYEWSSSWFNESDSLMIAINKKSRDTIGVNPDLRSKNLGFRVVIDGYNYAGGKNGRKR